MEALREAAASRDKHEIDVHGYRHVVREMPGATPFAQSAASPRRRGRRRDEELNVV